MNLVSVERCVEYSNLESEVKMNQNDFILNLRNILLNKIVLWKACFHNREKQATKILAPKRRN